MLKKTPVFGINLRAEREKQGLSIDDLAITLGVPSESVILIETGRVQPSGTLMVQCAQALDVSLQLLLLDGIDRDFCPIIPKPWTGMEVCQFCDRSYHPMMRWTLGGTRIVVCDDQACQDKAWEAGFEQRPDLTPKR